MSLGSAQDLTPLNAPEIIIKSDEFGSTDPGRRENHGIRRAKSMFQAQLGSELSDLLINSSHIAPFQVGEEQYGLRLLS